jgi:hypothetical protein
LKRLFRILVAGIVFLIGLVLFVYIAFIRPQLVIREFLSNYHPAQLEQAHKLSIQEIEKPHHITAPLQVSKTNPRYFSDQDGNLVYLTGSHTWCNFMDCGNTNPPPAFDYTAYLNFLEANNHNFFRLWRAENGRGGEKGDDFWFSPMPYERSATVCCAFDGGNKYDLEKFNQAYFDRLRERVEEADERGIYVSIMLFDGFSVESKFAGHEPWKGHPYNLQNNINDINGDVNGDGQGGETQTLTDPQILALQEAYVRKVIDTVNDLDNVLYEISNESSPGAEAWQYHMIDYIKTYEKSKQKQHPVGMTVELGGDNEALLDSPADWVSPNGYVKDPAVADGAKVVIADTDHFCGLCGDEQTVWKSFSRGQNPIFMDSYSRIQTGRGASGEYDPNNANDVNLRLNLGFTRYYAERMGLASMTPQPDLCSTEYCLANPVSQGAEYLVFLPQGGTVENIIYRLKIPKILHRLGIDKEISLVLPSDSTAKVDLRNSPVELNVEWFNPQDGTVVEAGTVQGGKRETFYAPFSGDAVLYLYNKTP